MDQDLFPTITRRWAALALLAAIICVMLVARWEEQLAGVEGGPLRIRTYGAEAAHWQGKDSRLYRKRSVENGAVSIEYSFVSRRNDQLQLGLSVSEKQYDNYRQSFGYRKQELDDLFKDQQRLLAEAYKEALQTRPAQAELDRTYARIKQDYRDRRLALFRTRGFRFLSESVLTADIPAIVRNNVDILNPAAASLARSVERLGYGPGDIIGAALSLVQTAVAYAKLPIEVDGRMIAGYSPPMEVMVEGRGDCDAKSGLLAAILLNWDKVRLIGVGLPGHYLLGVLQHPARGDAFIEYEGNNYVLIEPSGPAWLPPGTISDYSQKWLEARDQINIEKIAIN